MKYKLAVVGATMWQKSLVQKAKEMGIETHCFAWDKGDIVCKKTADYFYPVSVLEKEQILEVCQKVQIDGICSIAADICVPTVCYVAEKMGLIGNNYDDSLIAINKYLMRKAFYKNGINIPRFAVTGENDEIVLTDFTYPLIVKPTDRSGSIGVMKVKNEKDLKNVIENAQKLSFQNKAIVEEYITGKEVSVEAISWQGKHYILAITDKVTTKEPYFVELEHHQPSLFATDIQNKIRQETIKVLNALNIKYGASHTEIKVTEKGQVYVIEAAARMGGDFIGADLVRLSTGYDFVQGVMNISLGKFEEPVLYKDKHSGIYFLSKETEYLKTIIENSKEHSEIVTAEIYDEELRYLQSSVDRSGYLIYQSDRRKSWKQSLKHYE